MKRNTWIPLLIFVGLCVLLYYSLRQNPREIPTPLINKSAPTFQAPMLEADTSFSSNQMLGKTWVLNIWASWCAPCQVEHPILLEMAKQYPQLPIVGMNYKDKNSSAIQWLQRLGNPYSINISDSKGKIGMDFGVYGVPETYVIDAQGVIRYKHIGPLSMQDLQEKLLPALQQAGAKL